MPDYLLVLMPDYLLVLWLTLCVQISLSRVLGLTCHSANSLAVSDVCIAYPAG